MHDNGQADCLCKRVRFEDVGTTIKIWKMQIADAVFSGMVKVYSHFTIMF